MSLWQKVKSWFSEEQSDEEALEEQNIIENDLKETKAIEIEIEVKDDGKAKE